MTDDDRAIQAYEALNPTLFDILDRFELRHHYSPNQEHELSLDIWLRIYENEYSDARRLHLSFSGVRDLKIAMQGFSLLPHFRIRSVYGYQWEQLNYEVKDVVGETFSFYCRNFHAQIIEGQ